jgi:hypothetical protein
MECVFIDACRHEALSNEVMLLKAQLGDLNAVVEKVVNLF